MRATSLQTTETVQVVQLSLLTLVAAIPAVPHEHVHHQQTSTCISVTISYIHRFHLRSSCHSDMHSDEATLGQDLNEAERLLQPQYEMNEMVDLNAGHEIEQSLSRSASRYTDERSRADISGISSSQLPFMEVTEDNTVYKVYKRRWFGLVQLVLLNIVVSWDVSALNPKAPCQQKKHIS